MTVSVLVNATGAVSGGAKTWMLGITEELERGGDRGVAWTFLASTNLAERLANPRPVHITVERRDAASPLTRVLWEQAGLVRASRRYDVLVSGANFGPVLRGSRHVVIAHNALHFSEFLPHGTMGWRLRAEAALARASVHRATVVVSPTQAMAALIQRRTRRESAVLPFGPGLVRGQAAGPRERFTFAHRTSWGPHKRFADLLLAVRELTRTHEGRFVMQSTCDPRSPFAQRYRESETERALLDDPDIKSHVEMAGFNQDHDHWLDADAVVVPSDLESFCFPLAEAMAAGVPVIAADVPFAREICGDAAVYAAPHDPTALAAGMRRALEGDVPDPSSVLHREFSWAAHADGLSDICRRLAHNAIAR